MQSTARGSSQTVDNMFSINACISVSFVPANFHRRFSIPLRTRGSSARVIREASRYCPRTLAAHWRVKEDPPTVYLSLDYTYRCRNGAVAHTILRVGAVQTAELPRSAVRVLPLGDLINTQSHPLAEVFPARYTFPADILTNLRANLFANCRTPRPRGYFVRRSRVSGRKGDNVGVTGTRRDRNDSVVFRSAGGSLHCVYTLIPTFPRTNKRSRGYFLSHSVQTLAACLHLSRSRRFARHNGVLFAVH